jgi:ligand-binding sensor domain-containing protein
MLSSISSDYPSPKLIPAQAEKSTQPFNQRWQMNTRNQSLLLPAFFFLAISEPAISQTDIWESTGGPYGGQVNALTVNASGHIFAGTYPSGVFRSTDNGTSWYPMRNGLTMGAWSLAVNTANGQIFAGSAGVFRSTDNGDTWTQMGIPNTSIWSVAVNTTNGYAFAGTGGYGVYRSTSNGSDWTQVGITTATIRSLAVNSTGHIFAGTEGGGVHRSTDNGNTWTQVGLTSSTIRSLLIHPTSGHVLAGTTSGISRSTDNGATWTPTNLTSGSATALALSPSAGLLFAGVDGEGIYKSTNNGLNWNQSNTGLTNTRIYALAANSASGHIFVGTYATGVFRSTDSGSTWNLATTGLKSIITQSLAISASSGDVFAGTSGGVHCYSVNSASWSLTGMTKDSPYESPYSVFVNSKNGHIFAPTYDGTYRSTDNGLTWAKTTLTIYVVRTFALNTTTGYIFAGTSEQGVYLSSNNGDTWAQVGIANRDVRCLAISSATGHVFAATYGGGVYRSTDNGGTWTQTNNGLSDTLTYSLLIANPSIFVGSSKGVFRSTDNGNNWSPTGYTDPARVLAMNPSGAIFVLGGGIAYSTDNAVTWTNLGTSSIRGALVSLAISDRSGLIYVGCSGTDVYRSSASGPASTPTLLSPADNATNILLNPSLRWNLAAKATSYQLQVASNTDFSPLDYGQSDINGISHQVPGLAAGTKYYWRVRGMNGRWPGGWSNVWNFTTLALPSIPTLVSPADGATGIPTSVRLTWRASRDAASYRVQVSTSPGFSPTVFDQVGIADTSQMVTGLLNSTAYYWRVNAANGIDTSAWTDFRIFTTVPVIPQAPTLALPNNGAVSQPLSLALMWDRSLYAGTYRIQVSTDSTFASGIFLDDSTVVTNQKAVSGLSINTTYWWRVNAKNAAGTSGWSQVFKFKTETSSYVVERIGSDIPTEFRLGQNFPNPFNPRTTIEFDLPEPGHIDLRVYNSLGVEAVALVSGNLSAGRYKAEFNAGGYASGAYFYQLKAGDFVQTQKLVLLK